MQLSDLSRFKQLLTGMGVLYGKPVSELLLDIWWQALDKLEFANVKKALEAHVRNPDKGQFMPKPADVTAYVFGSSEGQALMAWSEVAKAVKEVGSYHSVIFADPLIHAVIRDMGGWIALCQSKVVELPFRAKEFEKRYQALVLHPPPDYPPQLTGVFEKENRLTRSPVAEPTLIGSAVHKHTALEDS